MDRQAAAPLVSVVIPALNEERRIRDCLAALSAQTYPADKMEILVSDGRSTDRTREVIRSHAAIDARVKLLDNPSGRTAVGLNLAIAASRGEVICRIDGHAVADRNYVERCVASLRESGAWCVGGRMEKVGSSPASAAIAAAATSRFGIGDSTFHYATTAQRVESVYLGCWPRSVFDKVGMFNSALVRNQDDEFSYRIWKAGGTVWFDPGISVRYYGRSSFVGLFRQYRQYGYWKVRVFRMHPGAIRWRHLVPGAFVGALVGSAVLTPFVPSARIVLGATTAAYGATSVIAAHRVASRTGGKIRPSRRLVMGAFAAMHAGYGVGLWTGLPGAIISPFRASRRESLPA